MRRVLVLLLCVAAGAEEAGFAEPEVEESELAHRRRATHADGKQYDYVQPEAEQAQPRGAPAQRIVEIEIDELLRAAEGVVGGNLAQTLRALLNPSSTNNPAPTIGASNGLSKAPSAQFRPRRKAAPLPKVKPDSSLAEVLQIVEGTLGRADDPGDVVRSLAKEAEEDRIEEEEEARFASREMGMDTSALWQEELRGAMRQNDNAMADGNAADPDAWIDRLDEAGLRKLGGALQARWRRAEAAWDHLQRRRAADLPGASGPAAAEVRRGSVEEQLSAVARRAEAALSVAEAMLAEAESAAGMEDAIEKDGEEEDLETDADSLVAYMRRLAAEGRRGRQKGMDERASAADEGGGGSLLSLIRQTFGDALGDAFGDDAALGDGGAVGVLHAAEQHAGAVENVGDFDLDPALTEALRAALAGLAGDLQPRGDPAAGGAGEGEPAIGVQDFEFHFVLPGGDQRIIRAGEGGRGGAQALGLAANARVEGVLRRTLRGADDAVAGRAEPSTQASEQEEEEQ